MRVFAPIPARYADELRVGIEHHLAGIRRLDTAVEAKWAGKGEPRPAGPSGQLIVVVLHSESDAALTLAEIATEARRSA